MSQPEFLSEIDASFEANWAAFVAATQAAYLAAHGRHAMARNPFSGEAIPQDAQPATPDQPEVSIDEQDEGWAHFLAGIATTALLAAPEVQIYNGPDGPGYVVSLFARDSETGQLWARSMNAGPETWRESPWIPINQETPYII